MSDMPTAAEIRWTLEPVPRIERVDLLALDADETAAYARDLQLALESVRVLQHESLDSIARVTHERDRARFVNHEMRRSSRDAARAGARG
jgi:hypothetical protein